MKFKQLEDNAAEKFEVEQAVSFADLAKQAQLQAKFSQLQSEYNNFITTSLLTEKNLHFAVLIDVI